VWADDRWLLHPGDAYFSHGQLDPVAPHSPPGLRLFESVVQKAARLANHERLRSLAAEHADEVTVFCAHDPVEYRRLAEPRAATERPS
jgi:glyoxylase-like metal-dependent hydrolase (beta-lactamase superfamily II)